MSQQSLFGELPAPTNKPLADRNCPRCKREWFEGQVVIVKTEGFTAHCPQCHAVLEQPAKLTRKSGKKYRELISVGEARKQLRAEAFDLTGWRLKPSSVPWLWLMAVSDLTTVIEVLAYSARSTKRELNKIKSEATKRHKRIDPVNVEAIVELRREFVEELRNFSIALKLRQKNG